MARSRTTIMLDDQLKNRIRDHQKEHYLEHDREFSRSDVLNFATMLFYDGFEDELDEGALELLRRWSDVSALLRDGDRGVTVVVGAGAGGLELDGGTIVDATADDRGRINLGVDFAGEDLLVAAFKKE